MSYYMMSGLGQGMGHGAARVARGGTVYKGTSPGMSHGIAVPGLTVYKGAHGYGYPAIESPPIGPAYHRPNPTYVYGAGAGPYVGRRPVSGFGGPDPASVCSDWNAGASGDNAAGTRAAQAVQAALNNAGYGPIAVDGIFGDNSIAAWNKFAAANGQTSGWPDCNGITVLMTTGGGGGASKAGMLMGLGLLALIAVGAAALLAKKKHGGAAAHHKGAHGHDRLIIEEQRA
jgi:hypothetical protein